jgi:hypothetical protein
MIHFEGSIVKYLHLIRSKCVYTGIPAPCVSEYVSCAFSIHNSTKVDFQILFSGFDLCVISDRLY